MSSSPLESNTERDSPDPASHLANVYDESVDEFEETTTISDDVNDFDAQTESDDLEFHEAHSNSSHRESESRSTANVTATGAAQSNVLDIPGLILSMASNGGNGDEQPLGRVRILQSNGRSWQISRPEILRLLAQAGPHLLTSQAEALNSGPESEIPDTDENDDEDVDDDDDDDDEDDDDFEEDDDFQGGWGTRRRRCTCRHKESQPDFPPVPNPAGRELMSSGEFGQNEYFQNLLRKRKQQMARRIMAREIGPERSQASRENRLIAQGLIPSSKAETIIHYNHRCYSGQFSDDGNFFFSCSQDYRVRMYDTSNPYDWKYYKSVTYPYAQWTITDATLSPDNKFLAYSSIRSHVCLASTDPGDDSEPRSLDFAHMEAANRRAWRESHFGIWSVRFSGDGRELVAGTSDNSVYVYDIESSKSILKIPGHHEDVNAVCFGDATSPHILYSGSDDTLIKVWDRRSIRDKREAGVFVGHTEGVTYVDSKGDGRYVLSNGKDQSMKLWDIRKMMSTEQSAQLDPQSHKTGFDYRFMTFRDSDYIRHPHDCSVVTFRGHSVLKTLIRCHFSPVQSTNSRYVYTGSEDGKVHIYNLDATLAGKVDVGRATHNTRPHESAFRTSSWMTDESGRDDWAACVRDVSWHPNAPIIAATSWNGWGMTTGTCSIHVWNDGVEDEVDLDLDTSMARRVNHKLEHDPSLYDNSRTRRRNWGSRLRRRTVQDDEEDDAEFFPLS